MSYFTYSKNIREWSCNSQSRVEQEPSKGYKVDLEWRVCILSEIQNYKEDTLSCVGMNTVI